MKNTTPNDKINLIIVTGLLTIACINVIGCWIVYLRSHLTPTEIILLTSNIASGLLGYLSREYKQATGTSSPDINADNVDTVNVTNTTTPADDATPSTKVITP